MGCNGTGSGRPPTPDAADADALSCTPPGKGAVPKNAVPDERSKRPLEPAAPRAGAAAAKGGYGS